MTVPVFVVDSSTPALVDLIVLSQFCSTLVISQDDEEEEDERMSASVWQLVVDSEVLLFSCKEGSADIGIVCLVLFAALSHDSFASFSASVRFLWIQVEKYKYCSSGLEVLKDSQRLVMAESPDT